MKRKLTQTEFCGQENPTKIMHTSVLPHCVNSNVNTTIRSPPLGKPLMTSTPPSYSSRGYSVAATRRGHQNTTAMDSGTETELRRVIDNFVNIYEQLDKCEGADVKPNYSYTELAYLAMLRSPNFCLPITEIYSYIESRFLFFKHSTRKHWKNAVRHSLAKTMCFTKIPIGRGASNCESLSRSTYLWCILPNSISTFARGDYRPSVDKESGTNTLRWGFYRVNAGQFWDQVGNYIADRMAIFRTHLTITQNPGAIFESQVCSISPLNQRRTSKQSAPQPYQLNSHQTNRLCDTTAPPNYKPVVKFESSPTSHLQYDPVYSPPPTYLPVHHHAVYEHNSYFKSSGSPQQPVNDPWMPKVTMTSPDSSFCSVESERRTPPYTSFDYRDSGNETGESSPEDSSYRMYPSCRQQQYGGQLSSPVLPPAMTSGFPDEHDLDNLELCPLVTTELPDICENFQQSCEQPKQLLQPNFSDVNYILNSNPQAANCRSPVTSPTPTNFQYHQYVMESPTMEKHTTQYTNGQAYMLGNTPASWYGAPEWYS